MMLYLKFIFFVFIYLISDSKWVIVESSGSEADPETGTEKQQTQSNATQLKPDVYPKHIKLFKADPNDANNTIELETTEYKVKKDGDDHIYEFNDGVNCNLLKIDDKEVWKYGTTKSGSSTDGSTTPDPSEANAKYPKSLEVKTETVFIQFDGSIEVYSKVDDGWYLNITSTNLFNQILSASKPADGSAQGGGTTPPANEGSGTDTSSGEGSGTNDDGTGKGAGEHTETGGGGGDGGSQPSSGSPTSGGTGLPSGGSGFPSGGSSYTGKEGDVTSGGHGPTAGGQDQGTKTGAADNAVQEKNNKSSSSKKKSSSGGFWSCLSSGCCSN